MNNTINDINGDIKVFFNNKTIDLERKTDETNEGIDFFSPFTFQLIMLKNRVQTTSIPFLIDYVIV